MAATTRLLTLAREQHESLYNSINNLFQIARDGLIETKTGVEDLKERHEWYHANLYQLHQLRKKIDSIQKRHDERASVIINEIKTQKGRAREILLNALNQVETTINTEQIRTDLNKLIKNIDRIIDETASRVSLKTIFRAFGFSAILATIIGIAAGSTAAGVATLGIGLAAVGVGSELLFRSKISDLISKLEENIKITEQQSTYTLQMLGYYFKGFEIRLTNGKNDNSVVKLVWYDKEIKSRTNQYHVEKLSAEFLEKNYPVIEMNDKNEIIQLIINDTEHDIILITSGSAGQEVISEIGSFWNIKGIIIFCGRVEQHRAWARNCKKVLLVTDRFDEVIQTIKDVQSAAVYFLNRGFTLGDITLKLPNIDYYLSIEENGFIITDFSVINSDTDYQKNKMLQLYNCLISRKTYPDGLPLHFKIDNLFKCAEKFSEALNELEPENKIIYLYTLERPYFYKIVNEILNLADKELMSIIGDYITALRYALLKYSDTTNTMSKTSNVKLYRGLHWENQTDFEQFLNKFKQSDIIIFPSFLSTSLNEHTATKFIRETGVLLEITADCTQLNKPKNIRAHSLHITEDEVLLNCFSLLKVNKIRKSADNITVYECNLKL